MRKFHQGGMLVLAMALAAPTFIATRAAVAKTTAASSDDNTASTAGMSKEDQEKLKEHNKLRSEIKKVHYPAAKSTIVSHVKGIKADDKKWFDQTLPDKTYTSADDVYSALGWPAPSAPSSEK
jgi:hypothetical protein